MAGRGEHRAADGRHVGLFQRDVTVGVRATIGIARQGDRLQRAMTTAVGLGANRPQDAVYPTSESEAAGQTYAGANKYVLHFGKDNSRP